MTIYAKGTDTAGNEQIVAEKILTLDIDAPATPVIESNYGYPILTEYGVKLDGATTITYDTRNDITNLYSIDNGKTWKEYTGTFSIPGAGTVIAKSVKATGLETVVTKTIGIPSDALGVEAYDGDESTFISTFSAKYMQVDPSVWGKKVRVKAQSRWFESQSIKFLDENNTVIYSDSLRGDVTIQTYDKIYTMPENTAKIQLYTNSNTFLIYEVQLLNEPIINEIYPLLTEYRVEQRDGTVQIWYDSTSVQRLYKIDDGNWQEYKNQQVNLALGMTIYAKGIDKYGNETTISSYTGRDDSLAPEAYDGDLSTYAPGGDRKNVYIDIDKSAWGKIIKLYYLNGYHGTAFLDSNGTESGWQDSRSLTVTRTIPENTTRLRLYFNEGGGLYEIELQD